VPKASVMIITLAKPSVMRFPIVRFFMESMFKRWVVTN
jgi:hypothetical protein